MVPRVQSRTVTHGVKRCAEASCVAHQKRFPPFTWLWQRSMVLTLENVRSQRRQQISLRGEMPVEPRLPHLQVGRQYAGREAVKPSSVENLASTAENSRSVQPCPRLSHT